MWCSHCHDDVAAAVASDNRKIRCATCGADLGLAQSLPSGSKTREARELLKRWSEESILDSSESVSHIQPVSSFSSVEDILRDSTASPEAAKNESEIAASQHNTEVEQQTSTSPSPLLRFDAPHNETASTQNSATPQTTPAVKTLQRHNAHENGTPAPHFDVQSAIQKLQQRKTNWTSLCGQLLAYCGVGLITIGTALVLWGYFGGPVHYTPTGWLVATAGQMLLFLGVIMLVSGGLEQTTEEVSRKMEQIGERLIRIEQHTLEQTLRGPNIPAERFSNEGTAKESADATVEQSADRPSL